MASAAAAVLKRNSIGLILIAALLGVGGQLSMKLAMNSIGQMGVSGLSEPIQMLLRIAFSPLVWGGLVLYGVGAAVWMVVLSRTALSFAYPIFAVTYALTPILAWLLLGESVNPGRWLGILVICAGVVLVSRT